MKSALALFTTLMLLLCDSVPAMTQQEFIKEHHHPGHHALNQGQERHKAAHSEPSHHGNHPHQQGEQGCCHSPVQLAIIEPLAEVPPNLASLISNSNLLYQFKLPPEPLLPLFKFPD